MDKKILLYDILDEKKNILNSQLIFDKNIVFEIPYTYYLSKDETSIDNNKLVIVGENDYIVLYFVKCSEDDFKKKIEQIKQMNNVTEEFINYRNQKIFEYFCNGEINIITFENNYFIGLCSKCAKYSKQYFTLYYILYSFDVNCGDTYENSIYQKNCYCILTNAKYLYEKYNINLIKYNPFEILNILNKESFCEYLINNADYDEKINNYYLMKDDEFKNIVNKIKNYKSDNSDNLSLMDLIEE